MRNKRDGRVGSRMEREKRSKLRSDMNKEFRMGTNRGTERGKGRKRDWKEIGKANRVQFNR